MSEMQINVDGHSSAELFERKIRSLAGGTKDNNEFAADYAAAMSSVVEAGLSRASGYNSLNIGLLGLRPGDRYNPRRGQDEQRPVEEYGEALQSRWQSAAMIAFMARCGLERLLTLDQHVQVAQLSKQAERASLRQLQQTGLSLELGHAVQYGDWLATKPLDAEVDLSIRSSQLSRAGLEFGQEYSRSEQHVRYSFTYVALEGISHHFIAAVRKRPVADLVYNRPPTDHVAKIMRERGISVADLPPSEVAKRSSFVIAFDLLNPNQQRLMAKVFSTDERERAYAHRGASAIVESVIALGDPSEQEAQLHVSPVMSLYFDRLRIRDEANKAVEAVDGMRVPEVIADGDDSILDE